MFCFWFGKIVVCLNKLIICLVMILYEIILSDIRIFSNYDIIDFGYSVVFRWFFLCYFLEN